MTLQEFKAWFEGFTEGIEGAPSEAQFAKIKAKVADINGTAVTERHYYDHYWHWHHNAYPWWQNQPYATWSGGVSTKSQNDFMSLGAVGKSDGIGQISYASNYGDKGASVTEPFDGIAAMYAAGKADFAN